MDKENLTDKAIAAEVAALDFIEQNHDLLTEQAVAFIEEQLSTTSVDGVQIIEYGLQQGLLDAEKFRKEVRNATSALVYRAFEVDECAKLLISIKIKDAIIDTYLAKGVEVGLKILFCRHEEVQFATIFGKDAYETARNQFELDRLANPDQPDMVTI